MDSLSFYDPCDRPLDSRGGRRSVQFIMIRSLKNVVKFALHVRLRYWLDELCVQLGTKNSVDRQVC
jgi:hypothetical protein